MFEARCSDALQVSSQQVGSLQSQLAVLNRAYLQEIKQLKEVLRQKTEKQITLKTQIQHLKSQCKNHGEQVAALLSSTLSPVKSNKSRKSEAETSICLQHARKRSEQDLKLNLGLKFMLPAQQNNKKMNSPRLKILKQTAAMENIEVKVKNRHKQLLGQKKIGFPITYIPLNQNSLCQKNTRYSYEFEKSTASPKQKKDFVKSIGFRTKINPEDKSIESKRSL